MKIAIAQLNLIIGNIDYNTKKIIANIHKAIKENADIIVFSELVVCGYPPRDLLEKDDFLKQIEIGMKKITKNTQDIAVVIGTPTINLSGKGKKLYNSAYFIYQKKIKYVQHKTLLPSYDVFNENRYFESNKTFDLVNFRGRKIALSICEDIWESKDITENNSSNLYQTSPITELIRKKPNILINLSASPFSVNKYNIRNKILSSISRKNNIPTIYVNQVGGYTDIIFDGDSKAYNKEGELICQLSRFKEDFKIFDINAKKIIKEIYNTDYHINNIYSALTLGINDYFTKTKFSKAVIGLSGGIDSAVTASLAVKALGNENVMGFLLPTSFSSFHSVNDAKDLARNLKIKYHKIDINDLYNEFINKLAFLFKDLPLDITEENLQARIRGMILMAVANKFNAILLNTSNKSELAVGYGTMYGDMAGGLSVLGDVYKTEVYKLAYFINKDKAIIPRNTIHKPPSAELKPNQLDSNTLPEYDVLDKILYQYINQNHDMGKIISSGIDLQLVKRVIKMIKMSEHKRYQAPPVLRVSNKAFGHGRQIPLDAAY